MLLSLILASILSARFSDAHYDEFQLGSPTEDKCCSLHNGIIADGGVLFQHCCNMLGYCPICVKRAKRECCPFWHVGDKEAFDICCLKYGFCPICYKKESPPAFGCWYQGIIYAVDTLIEIKTAKCLEIWCRKYKISPFIDVVHISDGCDCCEREGRVYPNGHTIALEGCRQLICVKGAWKTQLTTELKPCPSGYVTINNRCVFVWPGHATWTEAENICRRYLGASLMLPADYEENQLTAEALRLSHGGWLGARDSEWPDVSGPEWGIVSPWAPGQPDGGQDDQCLALLPSNLHQGPAASSLLWSDVSCSNYTLRPVCVLPRVPCHQTQCSTPEDDPLQRAHIYSRPEDGPLNTSVIDRLDNCQTITCSSGYRLHQVDPNCCQFEGWNPTTGQWISGYYMTGAFFPFPGMKCICRSGLISCKFTPPVRDEKSTDVV